MSFRFDRKNYLNKYKHNIFDSKIDLMEVNKISLFG